MLAKPNEGCPENTVPMAIPVDMHNKTGMGLVRPRSNNALYPNKLPNKVPISCCAHGQGTSSAFFEYSLSNISLKDRCGGKADASTVVLMSKCNHIDDGHGGIPYSENN